MGGGKAYLAQVHETQGYGVDAVDMGSDDLTIAWEVRDTYYGGTMIFSDSSLYCNDPDQTVCPDALPSSQYHHYPCNSQHRERCLFPGTRSPAL